MAIAGAASVGAIASTATTVTASEIAARIERIPFGGFHRKARIIVGTATFFDGFDKLSIAYVLPVLVPLWKLTPAQIAPLFVFGILGMLVGGLIGGWVADRMGRLNTMSIGVAIFGLMSAGCALAWSYESMLGMRAVQGVGLGMLQPVAAAYLNEMTRAHGRGRFFLIYEGLFMFGMAGAALLGAWMVPRFGWQSIFLVGAAPTLLVLMFASMLPESARWLAEKGRLAEADAVVREIEAQATRNGVVLPPVRANLQVMEHGHVSWTELFKGIYLKRTLVSWVIWFATYFVSFAIFAWLPTLYRTVFKLDLQTSLLYSSAATVAGLVGVIAVALFIDKVGRRLWIVISFLAISVLLGILWLSGIPTANFLLVCVSVANAFTVSMSALCFLYAGEIYPTRLRGRGVGVGTAWQQVSTAAGQTAVGVVLGSFGLSAVFLMFIPVTLFGALIAWLYAVETKEQILEEVSP
jgi:putative MFS transporter